jgi:hypothetical protein
VETNKQEYKARTAISSERFEGPWTGLVGCEIEVYDDDSMADWGRVDSITTDGKVLWLEQDGVRSRRMVDLLAGRVVFITVPHVSGHEKLPTGGQFGAR